MSTPLPAKGHSAQQTWQKWPAGKPHSSAWQSRPRPSHFKSSRTSAMSKHQSHVRTQNKMHLAICHSADTARAASAPKAGQPSRAAPSEQLMLKTGLQQLTDSLNNGNPTLCRTALHQMHTALESMHGSNTANAELPAMADTSAAEAGTLEDIHCITVPLDA